MPPEAGIMANCSLPRELTCITGSDDVHCDTRSAGDWRRFVLRFISRRTCLMIAIVCLVLLTGALLIAHSSPATGYELSIYASTPVLVWIFLALACAGGVFLIVHQVVTQQHERSRIWLVGFLILLLVHVSLLYVPYIRNYASWQGDNLTHWGHLRDILNTGHFTKLNPYPVTHTVLAQVVSVTRLPLGTAANLSTCFLSVGFVLSAYLLATATLPQKGQQMLAAAVAAAVMLFGGYHVCLMPNGWSIMLFPLLLYAVLKCHNWAHLVIALTLVVLYPFFHPLSSLMAGAALISIVLLTLALRYVFGRAKGTGGAPALGRILTLASIDLAILFPWLLSFKEHVSQRAPAMETATHRGCGRNRRHGPTIEQGGCPRSRVPASSGQDVRRRAYPHRHRHDRRIPADQADSDLLRGMPNPWGCWPCWV